MGLSTSSFSALQRAENFSIDACPSFNADRARVSVLFSEPKISQSDGTLIASDGVMRFSALQRAENFSMLS